MPGITPQVVWPGLALNYKPLDPSRYPADFAKFNDLGITFLRAPDNANAQVYIDNGFKVSWGPNTLSSLTAASWPAYHDSVMNTAATWQSNGHRLFDFELGNELEDRINGTDLTLVQLHNNLRQLAYDIKAVYDVGPISYHCYDKTVVGYSTYQEFIDNGLGGIDFICIHPYAHVGGANVVEIGGFERIEMMAKAFGPQCYISEFNVDADGTNMDNVAAGTAKEAFEKAYREYVVKFFAPNNSSAMLYLWYGKNDSGSGADTHFAIVNPYTEGYRMKQYSNALFNVGFKQRKLVT